MITPIKTMTINQIMERKDDLLVSVDDIRKVVRDERNKAIDEFKNALLNWNPQDEEYRNLSDVCNEIARLLKN